MALDDSMYQRLCALSERNALLFWEDEAGAFAGDVAGASPRSSVHAASRERLTGAAMSLMSRKKSISGAPPAR